LLKIHEEPGAVACALIALIVSRGSSLLIESIESLKGLAAGTTRNSICAIAGVVAGLLMGLDAFMWRESVAANRMAVSSVPWFMLVLVCLLRWLYARQQHRFLYWALFLFGLCFTTHQSLIVAAIGIEVLVAAGNPRLGRDLFLGNAIIYLCYELSLWFTGQHLFHNLGAKPGLLLLFNTIGIGSLIGGTTLAQLTVGTVTKFRDHLRTHFDVACEYADLKRSLAGALGHDRHAYMSAKGDFIGRAAAAEEKP